LEIRRGKPILDLVKVRANSPGTASLTSLILLRGATCCVGREIERIQGRIFDADLENHVLSGTAYDAFQFSA